MTSQTGYAAMGHHVPYSRRQKAYDAARQMGVNDPMPLIDSMSNCIRHDRPFEAMKVAEGRVDLIGAYRLLSSLLTD